MRDVVVATGAASIAFGVMVGLTALPTIGCICVIVGLAMFIGGFFIIPPNGRR